MPSLEEALLVPQRVVEIVAALAQQTEHAFGLGLNDAAFLLLLKEQQAPASCAVEALSLLAVSGDGSCAEFRSFGSRLLSFGVTRAAKSVGVRLCSFALLFVAEQ